MHTVNTLSVLPLIRKARVNKAGEYPIFLRLTVNSKSVELSTKHNILSSQWDCRLSRVADKTAKARAINQDLNNLELRCRNHYNQLLTTDQNITAKAIKSLLLGNTIEPEKHSLLNLFDKMVKDIKALIGKDYTESTYKNYHASQRQLHKYVQTQYKVQDISLRNLDYKFITGYELYLKTMGGCTQNGCIKHMQKLRPSNFRISTHKKPPVIGI